MSEWIACTERDAPEGEVVDTRILDAEGERNVQTLKRQGRLWFLPSGTMYVYYTPTHWKRLPGRS